MEQNIVMGTSDFNKLVQILVKHTATLDKFLEFLQKEQLHLTSAKSQNSTPCANFVQMMEIMKKLNVLENILRGDPAGIELTTSQLFNPNRTQIANSEERIYEMFDKLRASGFSKNKSYLAIAVETGLSRSTIYKKIFLRPSPS